MTHVVGLIEQTTGINSPSGVKPWRMEDVLGKLGRRG